MANSIGMVPPWRAVVGSVGSVASSISPQKAPPQIFVIEYSVSTLTSER